MTTVNHHDIDALVTSVAALFNEDAGQHDTAVNLDWPARRAPATTPAWWRTRPACWCWLAIISLTWARHCGVQHASVTAYAANDTAQRLYQRHGFVPKSVISQAAV